MGTVWEKISLQAISLFGKSEIKANKPKNKYSKKELEMILIEEVKKKIKKNTYNYDTLSNIDDAFAYSPYSPFFNTEKCPRCGSYGFSIDNASNSDIFSSDAFILSRYGFSDLYKCKKCHLELTKKEFDIVKEIGSGSQLPQEW